MAVCIPKKEFSIATFLFLQFIFNSERWRFSFGRKCFREKLAQMKLNLPVNEAGEIDEETMKKIVENTSYWNFIESSSKSGGALTPSLFLTKGSINNICFYHRA